jgi:hypothetical protein
MKYVVSNREGEQPDNWRLYFHLRSCLDTLCQHMEYQIDFNSWDDEYIEKCVKFFFCFFSSCRFRLQSAGTLD